MKCQSPQHAEMVYWDYGPPPSALDLVDNGPVSAAARIAVHLLLRGYLRLFHRYACRCELRLERLRGHLIVANHCSHLDALALFSAFPLGAVNNVRSVCAEDYFFRHPLRRRMAFLLANTIPMARDRFDRRAASYCREKMQEGANIILFPEGTRSRDGRMGPFKAGVGVLALKYAVPVLPAAVTGTHECCGPGAFFPRPGRIEVVFGRPVLYRGEARVKQNWLWIAQDLRRRVGRLAGHLREEQTDHERAGDQGIEDVGSYVGPAQRRDPHRPPGRAHLGQDAGLRLQERAVRGAGGRQVP